MVMSGPWSSVPIQGKKDEISAVPKEERRGRKKRSQGGWGIFLLKGAFTSREKTVSDRGGRKSGKIKERWKGGREGNVKAWQRARSKGSGGGEEGGTKNSKGEGGRRGE